MRTLETTSISAKRPKDLIDGYRLEKLVGQGGMGEVHKATQLSLGRTVAIKLLASEHAADKAFVARFEKEAAALATLSHPNIVAIVDKGKSEDGTYYLVMEFVDGPSLREVMRSPLLDTTTSLRMVMEICRAIDYAHTRGVVHRDLKPENILFDEQAGGIAKVTDFGLAGFLEDKSSKFNVTETHVSMGTLSYMAPEQRVDAKSADHRADIYSLGVIIYELMVGELPVGTFDPPSHVKPELDKRLDPIVARCLKPIPNDRYQKVSELIADLEPMVPISFSQPPRKVSRVERWRRRSMETVRYALRAVSVAVVVAAAAVLGLGYLRSRTPVTRSDPGMELTADLKPQTALTAAGGIVDLPEHHKIVLGQGPETLGLVARGRPARVDQDTLELDADAAKASRVDLDLVDASGLGMTLGAEVAARQAKGEPVSAFRHWLYGTHPDPRAALMLRGGAGRYVTVILSGAGQPVLLEWGFGERRGTMLGPDSPSSQPARLRLSVHQGEIRAYVDSLLVGEPIRLGPDWRAFFGANPVPGMGCLDADCSFAHVHYDLDRPPPPPPAPAPKARVISAKATSKGTTKAAAKHSVSAHKPAHGGAKGHRSR